MARLGATLGLGRTWLRLVPKLEGVCVSISEEKVVIWVEDWWCHEGGVLVGTKVGVLSHVRVKLPYSPQRLEDEDAVGPDISLDTVPLPEG